MILISNLVKNENMMTSYETINNIKLIYQINIHNKCIVTNLVLTF